MNEKVTRLLKNYRSYRYAVNNGIAPYQSEDTLGMPMGGSFGPRSPVSLLGRGSTIASQLDYQAYGRVVRAIDGAVADVLDDDERGVVEKKYLNRNRMTLFEIADAKKISERTIIRKHKSALKKLELSLKFVEEPEIINLDEVTVIAQYDSILA